MKQCPQCHISVGGAHESCPLCQNKLIGVGEIPYFPPTARRIRRFSMLYKVIAFVLLSAVVVCAAADFLLEDGPHRHWSVLVLAWVLPALAMLRSVLWRPINAPKLLFQIFAILSVLVIFTDFYNGYSGYSLDWVVPVLCSAALVLNFIFAFMNHRFADNALVYLLLNMVVGVLPYLLLLFRLGDGRVDPRSMPWVMCLIISALTFLGLVIFQGRTLKSEFEKRLHM